MLKLISTAEELEAGILRIGDTDDAEFQSAIRFNPAKTDDEVVELANSFYDREKGTKRDYAKLKKYINKPLPDVATFKTKK